MRASPGFCVVSFTSVILPTQKNCGNFRITKITTADFSCDMSQLGRTDIKPPKCKRMRTRTLLLCKKHVRSNIKAGLVTRAIWGELPAFLCSAFSVSQ